jgi:hypothetical protein
MSLNLFSFASMSLYYYILLVLPVLILVNFIKNIKHLTIASSCANIIQLTSLLIIVYNLVKDVPSISNRESFGDKLPLFVSTTLFTYEGITIVRKLLLNN